MSLFGDRLKSVLTAPSGKLIGTSIVGGKEVVQVDIVQSVGGSALPGDTDDFDTGGGIDLHGLVGIALPAAGGHAIGGTVTDPFRTDPVGATVQPVSVASTSSGILLHSAVSTAVGALAGEEPTSVATFFDNAVLVTADVDCTLVVFFGEATGILGAFDEITISLADNLRSAFVDLPGWANFIDVLVKAAVSTPVAVTTRSQLRN